MTRLIEVPLDNGESVRIEVTDFLPLWPDGFVTELINLARTPAITRYRYRGDTIPNPWKAA